MPRPTIEEHGHVGISVLAVNSDDPLPADHPDDLKRRERKSGGAELAEELLLEK